jgi:hypothetical protein
MRAFTEEQVKDSFTEHMGGISRTIKCDDDLTILEVVYEQNNNSRICLEESAERSSL